MSVAVVWPSKLSLNLVLLATAPVKDTVCTVAVRPTPGVATLTDAVPGAVTIAAPRSGTLSTPARLPPNVTVNTVPDTVTLVTVPPLFLMVDSASAPSGRQWRWPPFP